MANNSVAKQGQTIREMTDRLNAAARELARLLEEYESLIATAKDLVKEDRLESSKKKLESLTKL